MQLICAFAKHIRLEISMLLRHRSRRFSPPLLIMVSVGLYFSVCPLACSSNFAAIFQGYLTFTRYNHYWGVQTASWGFQTAPWILIGGFFFLVCACLIKTRVKEGRWTWQSRDLERVDLVDGVAPLSDVPKPNPVMWRRILQKILDAI